jgi:prepilin-type N-terminal cleavage/methylation domain-containing protein
MNEDTMEATGERGATLIELLMSMVLSGILLAALTGGIMTYFRVANSTRYLLTQTPELQLAATRFSSDATNAATSLAGGDPWASVSAPATSPACAVPSGWTQVVEFRWTDPYLASDASDDRPMAADYNYDASGHTLQRVLCQATPPAGGWPSGSPPPVPTLSVTQKTTLITTIKPGSQLQARCLPTSCAAPQQVDLGQLLPGSPPVWSPLEVCTAASCPDTDIPVTFTGVLRRSV